MDFGFFHAVNPQAEAVMPNSVTAFTVSKTVVDIRKTIRN
jgi:hypothetical protein